MALLNFSKYQGTGNDFVMIDDRSESFDMFDASLIQRLCDRKFGIGADGLIVIREADDYDFEMFYYNADGTTSFCGNGARCAVQFAHERDICGTEVNFKAIDGEHEAQIDKQEVNLKMGSVDGIEEIAEGFFVDTGAPHVIVIAEELETKDVPQDGAAIRYNNNFKEVGTNVNFVEVIGDDVFVRTYERGVEDETLSCGTGVTATSIVLSNFGIASPVKVRTKGGILTISYEATENGFENVYLKGPAVKVFGGIIDLTV